METELPIFPLLSLLVQGIVVLVVMPLRKSIDDLRQVDETNATKAQQNYLNVIRDLQELQVKVAERYTPRTEMGQQLAQINTRLDQMNATLERANPLAPPPHLTDKLADAVAQKVVEKKP